MYICAYNPFFPGIYTFSVINDHEIIKINEVFKLSDIWLIAIFPAESVQFSPLSHSDVKLTLLCQKHHTINFPLVHC